VRTVRSSAGVFRSKKADFELGEMDSGVKIGLRLDEPPGRLYESRDGSVCGMFWRVWNSVT
jgi:hypothetical protein